MFHTNLGKFPINNVIADNLDQLSFVIYELKSELFGSRVIFNMKSKASLCPGCSKLPTMENGYW